MRCGKDLSHLIPRSRSLSDSLMLVSQHEEVRATKVPREEHELRERIVLDLDNHHIARVLDALARD